MVAMPFDIQRTAARRSSARIGLFVVILYVDSLSFFFAFFVFVLKDENTERARQFGRR